MRPRFILSLIASVSGLLVSTPAAAAELLLLSTTSAREALGEIIPMFERATGNTVGGLHDCVPVLHGDVFQIARPAGASAASARGKNSLFADRVWRDSLARRRKSIAVPGAVLGANRFANVERGTF